MRFWFALPAVFGVGSTLRQGFSGEAGERLAVKSCTSRSERGLSLSLLKGKGGKVYRYQKGFKNRPSVRFRKEAGGSPADSCSEFALPIGACC